MKTKFKFFGALLIAGSLMFTSCEKEDLDDPITTEQPTDTTNTNDTTATTNTTDKDSTDQKGDGTDKKVVCFKGKLILEGGRFFIIENGRKNFLIGKESHLNQHINRCVKICTYKIRDDKDGDVFEVTDISRCENNEPDTVAVKKCFKGRLIKDSRGRFGIKMDNIFHRFAGRENELKEHFDRCVEVCGVRFKDNDGEVYDVVTIVKIECKVEDKDPNEVKDFILEGDLEKIDGKMGIMKNGKFHILRDTPNRPIAQYLGKFIKVKVILIQGEQCTYDVLDIHTM